jgi:hypothetical protein
LENIQIYVVQYAHTDFDLRMCDPCDHRPNP